MVSTVPRIVLATFGSLGDLHPFLALALGLRECGAAPVLATHELYRERIEALGIEFAPLRPNYDPNQEDLNLLSMDPWRGTEAIIREGLFPNLRDTYHDLARAAEGASLLVSHTIVFPAPLVAEKAQVPWASVLLAPMALMSATDPPHPAPVPWVNKVWSFGPRVNRVLINLIRRKTERWCEPVQQLRRELGLPPGGHPLFEGQHSSLLALALFSKAIGVPQPDWPRSVRQTGFCFLPDGREMPPGLQKFLDGGPAPVVFTLGSAAVLTAGDFFVESARAVDELRCRAVFIAGSESRVAANNNLFITQYAPYSKVFPRASVAVHQGGIGTTAQALRAGTPALIVPFAHDQPDNAARVVRAGAGRSIPRAEYSAARVIRELKILLAQESFRTRARAAADQIACEDGVDAACRAMLECI
jgi:UDP:flavonoid glycosyltransferase YjiC (YdhE family)